MRIILLILAISSIYTDEPPTWANKFSQYFEETMKYPVIGEGHTTGTMYYDFNTLRSRLDRQSGRYDRYCGTVYKFQDTPCTHYVSEGMRYLHFPDKNYCCMCCTSEKGCGVLKPNWMEGANMVNEYENDEGKYIQVWRKDGSQTNLIHVYKDTGMIWIIDMQPNDIMKFDAKTYKEDFDEDLLSLPQICNPNNKCGFFTTCSAIRGEKTDIEVIQE